MDNNVGRLVKIDNNEYVIVGYIYEDNDTYLYLVSVDDELNVVITKEKKNCDNVTMLEKICDQNEKMRIYNLFIQKAKLGLL